MLTPGRRKWLEEKYPGANIVVADHGREMLAEVEPGLAIAMIEKSTPHFHLHMRETYKIVYGALAVVIAGKVVLLEADPDGELKYKPTTSVVIHPGDVHHAISVSGIESVVEVRSDPPWSPDDHFEV